MGDMSNFTMVRNQASHSSWHGLESKLDESASMSDWMAAAGLNFNVEKRALYMKAPDGTGFQQIKERDALVRTDNGMFFEIAAERYTIVQPSEIESFFSNFILTDSRFKKESAGALKGGRVIWMLARFESDLTVIGSKHRLYCCCATSYDKSRATTAMATPVRVECENTLAAACYAKDGIIRIPHSSKFDQFAQADAVSTLAKVCEGFDKYKEFAESLHKIKLQNDKYRAALAQIVGIDPNDKELSTRSKNIIATLDDCMTATMRESGTDEFTAWSALNTITRYVDHERTTRKTIAFESNAQARLFSANFSSGAAIKAKACEILAAMA